MVYSNSVVRPSFLLTLSVGWAVSEELGCPLEEGMSVSCLVLRLNCLVHINLSSPAMHVIFLGN